VLAGGTLVVNYAQEGWNSYPANPVQWVPGGTTFSIALSDSLLITNPASPITAGITDLDLQGWGYSTHGNLLGPAANVIIVEPTTLGPTFIAYPYGLGKVYVTMQTVEYGYVYDYTGAQHHLLRNELTTILLPVPL
jgi:hypothetical protein